MLSYDLETGRLVWECAGLGDNTIPQPVRQGDLLLVMSGYRNPKLMAIRLGREGDLTGTDAIVWTETRGLSYTPSPVLHDGILYLLTDNGQHPAVDPHKEADTIGKLVESLAGQEHPHDRAAAMVGKSPSWVRDRLRLRALSPAWRKAFADPKGPIHEWPVAHLEVVAALPEAVQDQVVPGRSWPRR